ncbi:MAG: diphosphomevalonate decarboxylase [Candidatus Helarchaeota archaeon]
MKVTAIACSNIALVKYWGKRDEKLKIPQNNSISITLDKLQTTTTVDFDSDYTEDTFIINNKIIKENQRIKQFIDHLRQLAGVQDCVMMQSKTNFPMAAGLASSASGYAALSVAGSKALGLNLSDRELSILARRGSGSACRSIIGGFVEWQKGQNPDGSDSYAIQLAPPHHWNIQLIIAISSFSKKSIPSTVAMRKTIQTSPYYQGWLDSIETDLINVRKGIQKKDIKLVGETAERNCLKMHALMLSTIPSLLYWNETTLLLIKRIQQWRTEGFDCYFTIDAGPNVVVLCPEEQVEELKNHISRINTVQKVMICKPGPAPYLSDQHLF